MGDGGWGCEEKKTRGCGVRDLGCDAAETESSLLGQFLTGDGVDGTAFCPAFELWEHFAHDCSDLGCAASDCCFDRGAKLFVADLRRQVLLQRSCFGQFLVGEIVAVSLLVKLHRLSPFLDRFAQNVDDIRVSRIASQLDLFILDLGQDGAKEKRAGLVLGFASGIEIALEPGEQL